MGVGVLVGNNAARGSGFGTIWFWCNLNLHLQQPQQSPTHSIANPLILLPLHVCPCAPALSCHAQAASRAAKGIPPSALGSGKAGASKGAPSAAAVNADSRGGATATEDDDEDGDSGDGAGTGGEVGGSSEGEDGGDKAFDVSKLRGGKTGPRGRPGAKLPPGKYTHSACASGLPSMDLSLFATAVLCGMCAVTSFVACMTVWALTMFNLYICALHRPQQEDRFWQEGEGRCSQEEGKEVPDLLLSVWQALATQRVLIFTCVCVCI